MTLQALWIRTPNQSKIPKPEVGKMKGNPLSYFPTPFEVARKMVELIDQPTLLLEPEAGEGHIVDVAAHYLNTQQMTISCCEISVTRSQALERKGFHTICHDFLDCAVDQVFDAVLMNPPFSKPKMGSQKGNQTLFIDHILHAWEYLVDSGDLVAILPPSWEYRQDKKTTAFREFVMSNVIHLEHLPDDTFKESGTRVKADLIHLRK